MLRIIGRLHLLCRRFARWESHLILCFNAKCFQNKGFSFGLKSGCSVLEESDRTQQNGYFDKTPPLK